MLGTKSIAGFFLLLFSLTFPFALQGLSPKKNIRRNSAKNGVLTFQQRLDYQRAVEEVYWRHPIWPKENPGPKPPLAKVISDEAIAAKVEDYLRKSNALEQYWNRP